LRDHRALTISEYWTPSVSAMMKATAHDRRHDLSAHRSGGLDTGGEGAAIAELDHQGIVNCPTVTTLATPEPEIVPSCPTRTPRLGRTAAGAAEQAERDVGEQLDHAGAFEERAEQDEQEDISRET